MKSFENKTKIKNFKELSDLHKLYKKEAIKLFRECIVKVFEVHPTLEAIRWNQYVPGFNDGDPCTFTIGEIFFLDYETKKEIANTYPEHGINPDTDSYQEFLEYYGDWDCNVVKSYVKDETKTLYRKTWIDGKYQEDLAQPYHPFKEPPEPIFIDGNQEFFKEFYELTCFIYTSSKLMESIFGTDVSVLLTRNNDPIVEEYDCGY